MDIDLVCALYGQNSTRTVKVARDASAMELRNAIAGELRRGIFIVLLTFFLARKHDAWLSGPRGEDAKSGESDLNYPVFSLFSGVGDHFPVDLSLA